MNQKQFGNVIQLSPHDRYIHFISKVADWEELWSLRNSDGFVIFGDPLENECIPVWPHPDYANALIKDSWSDCYPERIDMYKFLEKWIPGMIEDKRMIAVFPTLDENGIIVNPERLNGDLLDELEQYQ